MAEPSPHINYSFEEIKRYLSGGMSAAEMHDIEKAALQDPFLADAIEGFNKADFTKAQQHINEINASLLKEKKPSKVVAFNKRSRLLNVAAVVIVLAGIGIVLSYVLSSTSKNHQTEIAKVEQQPARNKLSDNDASSMDSATVLNDTQDVVIANTENKKPIKDQLLTARKTTARSKSVNDINGLVPGSGTVQKEREAPPSTAAPSAPALNETALNKRSYIGITDTNIDVALQGKVSGIDILPSTFSGKVTDETNKPIAGVTIASYDKKVSTLTDINGNFNLQQTDSLLNATASTVGYNTRAVVLQNNADNEIILQPNNQALNEIVVTGLSAPKKKNAQINSVNNTGDSAKPVGGWKNFNNYIVTELSKDTANFSDNEDLVELEFLVDKSGKPYDITVTKSLNEQHSSKAKALLENGPKWVQPSKRKKAKVVINF